MDIFIPRNSGKTYVSKQGFSSFFALDRPAIAWTVILDQARADWIFAIANVPLWPVSFSFWGFSTLPGTNLWSLLGTPITDFIVLSGKDFDPSDPSFLPFLFLTSMASASLKLWVATSLSQNLMAEDYRRAGDDT